MKRLAYNISGDDPKKSTILLITVHAPDTSESIIIIDIDTIEITLKQHLFISATSIYRAPSQVQDR